MYIASVRIENFRGFENTVIEFNPGINALIGENNSGKTTVLQALALLFARHGRSRPTLNDFYRCTFKPDVPPGIRVTVTIRSSGMTDTLEDRALVAKWLTKLDTPWEALLTYVFALPEDEHDKFKEASAADPSQEHYWAVVEDFLPKYLSIVLGGNPANQLKADAETLAKFDFQFLEALRDADAEMLFGSAPLLKSMLVSVLDKGKDNAEKESLRRQFRDSSGELIDRLIKHIDLSALLDLATSTGAEDGGIPALAGALHESDMLSALGLAVKSDGVTIPASRNGLGYKNLLYMSLVMAKIELAASAEKVGQNASVFPMLVVEEPEAHLHPTQQYKLLKYINERVKAGAKCRQVFLSTHSTHITSAVGLDSIIWLAPRNAGGARRVGYPGRCFRATAEGRKSKSYVERYLDATKSNMLFAKGVLLVEGMAEQLLLPAFAEYLGISLATHHVATIAVGGVTFGHFLPLFGGTESTEARNCSIPRPVACVVDADPSRRLRSSPPNRYRKCWPYQLDLDTETYEYKPESDTVTRLREDCIKYAGNLEIFSGKKTLEYDLAIANRGCSMLAERPCIHEEALKACLNDPTMAKPVNCDLEEEALQSLKGLGAGLGEQEEARFATCYLCHAEATKGANAFALNRALRANLEGKPEDKQAFDIPEYLKDAVRWVCNKKAE